MNFEESVDSFVFFVKYRNGKSSKFEEAGYLVT